MDAQKYLKNVVTLEYDRSRCIGCRMCVEVCPHNVFRMVDHIAEVVRRDRCIECGACEINCLPGALRVKQGVGCASAVINSFFKGGDPACGCGENEPCCGSN